MSRPLRHYTDDPSNLRADLRGFVLRIEGTGFVTRAMVDATLSPYDAERNIPQRVLIDLRNVSGYEDHCVAVATEWLAHARKRGVERIAFVANSAVVRTATDLASQRAGVPLRTFRHDDSAERWLSCSGHAPESRA